MRGLVQEALGNRALPPRARLRRYLDIVTARLAADFAAEDLAEFLLASWQGAILRMKVDRDPAPLERFKTIAFATVFKETGHDRRN